MNQAFADAFLKDVDPLGVSLTVWMQGENPYLPVIGVVGDVSEGSVRDNPQPTVFYSHRQMPETTMTLFIRTAQPAAVTPAAIAAIRRLDSNLPVTRIRTFEGALGDSVARERLSALVSGGLALSGEPRALSALELPPRDLGVKCGAWIRTLDTALTPYNRLVTAASAEGARFELAKELLTL